MTASRRDHDPECGCRQCLSALHAGDGVNPYLLPAPKPMSERRMKRLFEEAAQGCRNRAAQS